MVNRVWLMNLGRFIFGIGGESLAVAQNTYAVLWFRGKDLNLVFGLQLSMARLVSCYVQLYYYSHVINTFPYVKKTTNFSFFHLASASS